MIIHHDTRPLAALALFILVCMMLLGLLFAGTEIPNPLHAGGEATRMSHQNKATESVFSATETKRASESNQMATADARSIEVSETVQAIEIQKTAIPQQRTAEALAVQATMDKANADTSQVIQAVKAQGEISSVYATATALARNQERERQHDDSDKLTGILGLAGSGGLLAALSTLALSLAKWLRTRARIEEREALARLQAERRRTIALEAAVRQAPRPSHPTLALKPGPDETPTKED